MGNVINFPTEKDISTIDTKDHEYLDLSSSSIFNDEYVSNIYRSLPNFDGVDSDELIKKKAAKKLKLINSDIDTNESRTHYLMNVYSARPEHIPIESFKVL